MKIIITGGAGFIGSHFVYLALAEDHEILVVDSLTYASNLNNIAIKIPQLNLGDMRIDTYRNASAGVNENDSCVRVTHIPTGMTVICSESKSMYKNKEVAIQKLTKMVFPNQKFHFINADICDLSTKEVMDFNPDVIVNFAAETHVDNSISKSYPFLKSNAYGVMNLMDVCRVCKPQLFIQISTDEVYGSLKSGSADENYPTRPSNPYSASKVAGEALAYSYFKTHNVPVIITRCSNNYGSNQHPEKMIPHFIKNLSNSQKIPLYGNGMNVRDWIHVEDHARAIMFLIKHGTIGEIYNIAGRNELSNIDIVKILLNHFGKDESFIDYVKDRPGHDFRYSLNDDKLRKMGFETIYQFEHCIKDVIQWYQENL